MNSVSDKDWKQSIGFPINYDSDQSCDDNFDTGDVVVRRHGGPRSSKHLLEDGGDGAVADLLGTTPPRARIRNKEKRRTVLMDSEPGGQKMLKETRRYTTDNVYNPERSPDTTDRMKKRASLKLARTRDRDWKQDIGSKDYRADSLPSPNLLPQEPAIPTLVESCSRFMSLTSRLKCRAALSAASPEPCDERGGELPASRVNFHKTFSLLINMGGGDKGARRTISREEQVWQNELKDLIWLELQAKIAGRSLPQQDSFLCAQRNIVPAIIRNIMEYRFINTSPCKYRTRHADGSKEDTNGHTESGHNEQTEPLDAEEEYCLAFDCPSCSDAIGKALREVGTLLDSFYNAVSLYPSSKAMTTEHPLVATQLFKNRLKAMCLWYNIALHMRMKILAVRKLFRSMHEKHSRRYQHLTSVDSDCSAAVVKPCLVKFNLNGNPSDSNNSDSSSQSEGQPTAGGRGDAPEGGRKERDEVDCAGEKRDVLGEQSAATTPEIVISDIRSETMDTSSSAESGYTSDRSARRESVSHEDVYNIGALDELTSLSLLNKSDVSPYRNYLSEILKTQGVRRSMMFIQKLRTYILQKVYMTFEKPDSTCSEPYAHDEESAEVFDDTKEPTPDEVTREEKQDELAKNAVELRRYGCRSAECQAMRLPSYRSHFLLLNTVSMELVHDYLALRLDSRPDQPSCLTIKQMIHELKEGIDIATDIRAVFVKNIEVTLDGYRATDAAKEKLLLVIRTFDATVENVLKQYLSYLQTLSVGKYLPRAMLQTEWSFTARLAKRMQCVAVLAPVSFTEIMCNQLVRLRKQFEDKFAEFSKREEDYPGDDDDADVKRYFVYSLCREAHCIYASDREMAIQTVQFARVLAFRLSRAPVPAFRDLREKIFTSLMSFRDCIVYQTRMIVERSNFAPAEMSRETFENISARLRELLLQVYKLGFELHKELYRFTHQPIWPSEKANLRQRPASLQPIRPETPVLRRKRPETVLIHESFNPLLIHREVHRYVNESERGRGGCARRRSQAMSPGKGCAGRPRPALMRLESIGDDVDDRLFEEDSYVIGQKQSSIELLLSGDTTRASLDEVEVRTGSGADWHLEEQWAKQVARAIIEFAQCWMRFVTQRCDRGRGLRPRWANQGLEFLMLACDPYNTKHLSDTEFEELKQLMDECISHVIGSRPSCARAAEPQASPAAPRRNARRIHSPLSAPVAGSPVSREVPTPPTPPTEPDPVLNFHGVEHTAHSRRVQEAISQLDSTRDLKLRSCKWVGRVLEAAVTSYEPKLRQVTFKWQRGLKIGAGTFGKVYTVINTETSQLLAMKELSIGIGDRRAMRRAANELRVLEGVIHPHLVRYYGCELHREEMLIFMELCVEGSLETLVATSGPLPEQTVRKYTKQLVSAVVELHHRNIAHRDIKSGNIFLTNEGHCLKLGDFGCAVKIRANTTAVGELQGTVGTQAYMAPEMFMKSSGHGRAADIWSLGCVVTEMASGKRPFSECDSNYQIMFMVGMGGRPTVPDTLSEEGQQFCISCLTHEPEQRPKAHALSSHHFLMVKSDEDCNCEPAYLKTKM